jgi:hypothetical protein
MHCQINKLSILENTTTPLDLTTIKKESQSTKFIPVTSIRDLVPIRREPDPEGIWRRSSQNDESETINKMKDQQTLLNLLTDKVFYISHPSISSLECNVSLKGPHVDTALFILLVAEILKLSRFNLIDIKIDYKTFSLHFKDVAAMKLLNLIFKDRFDHVLYPLYYKWIEGAEWMSKV